MDKFIDFFEEAYNVNILTFSSPRVQPGAIIDTEWVRRRTWPIRSRVPDFGRVRGYAWELLGEDVDDYPTETYDGQILVGTLTDRVDLSAGINIPFLGLTIGGGFESTVRTSLEVSEVRKEIFEHGFQGDRLRNKLRSWKEQGNPDYVSVDEDYLVTVAYYFEDLKWTFEEGVGADFKAAIERGEITIDAGFDATWGENTRVLTFSGTCECPVAFSGLKI